MRGAVIRTIMILALSAGSFFVCAGQEIPVRTTSKENLAYRAGEKIKYMIHYDWGLVSTDVGWGQASLSECVYDGKECFRADVEGQTGKIWDKLFRVREKFSSTFTADGLVPQRFTRDTHEGGYEARNTYVYRWDEATPYIDADVYSSHGGQKSLHLPLDHNTYDLPALFYLARNMDFDKVEPGVRHPMTFAIDDDVYHVHFVLYGREKKKVKGLGTIDTIRFSAKLVAGEVFTGEQDMMIWVSDDENRLPVYFEAPIWIGKVNGRLIEYSGLRHKFVTAK